MDSDGQFGPIIFSYSFLTGWIWALIKSFL